MAGGVRRSDRVFRPRNLPVTHRRDENSASVLAIKIAAWQIIPALPVGAVIFSMQARPAHNRFCLIAAAS
jgi:hypothetical protein